jgi:hypothetical protein
MGTVDVVVVGNSVVVVGSTVVVVVDDVVVVVGATVVVVGGSVVVVVGATVVVVVLVVDVVVVVLDVVVVDEVVVVGSSVVVVFAGSPLKLNSYRSFQLLPPRQTLGSQQHVPARRRYRPGCTSTEIYDCKPKWSSTLTIKVPCSSYNHS